MKANREESSAGMSDRSIGVRIRFLDEERQLSLVLY
jgi:hypothetical protein